MVPLALKVADVDENICESEKEFINKEFINEWGYDPVFVKEGVSFVSSNLSNYSIKDVAHSLAEFQKVNSDCNYDAMSKELVMFLSGIMESDNRIDEKEERIIQDIERIFFQAGRINIWKKINFV